MGVAEIIGFAACWMAVASLMLWGVFTEHKRGGDSPAEVGAAEWIVIETAEGSNPEVVELARFMAAAWLASRGIDIEALPPADLRSEVTSSGDGATTARILVRAGALNPGRRHVGWRHHPDI